jgi:hypothetical protein
MRPLSSGVPDVGFDHIETDRVELVAEGIHRPPVRRGDGMGKLLHYRAFEKTDEQGAMGTENAVELEEGIPDRAGLVVNEGIPGKYAAHGTGFDIEGVKTAGCKGRSGIGGPCTPDELGYRIDPVGREPVFGEKVRPLSWPAAGIDDAALDLASPCRDELAI